MSDAANLQGVTHIVCNEAPACASRAAELRARAGVGPHVPLVTRQFFTDALRSNTRPSEAAYLIQEDQPRRESNATQVQTPPAGGSVGGGERCDTCRARLLWSEVGRCLCCTAREPAAARAVRLRYRAAHPHNRELVAALNALYELEVARAGGAPDKLNAAEAFSRAAAVLKAAPHPLLDEESVLDADLPYVGEKVRRLAAEFVATGKMARLEQLRGHARTVATAALLRIPWVGAAAATAWAAGGARCAADVRAMDAEGTLQPSLPMGRALQRVAMEHAEEVRLRFYARCAHSAADVTDATPPPSALGGGAARRLGAGARGLRARACSCRCHRRGAHCWRLWTRQGCVL